jgi:orotate phosphoribosyltransferase-like protein
MALKKLYTPIVKGKENDFKAIGKMPSVLAARTFPLVELLAPDEPFQFDASYLRFGSQLRKHCPDQLVSVDLHSIAPGQKTADGSLGLEALCGYLKGLGVDFVPVFGFDHEPELWDRIAKIAHREGRGLTVRLTKEDLVVPDDTLQELLDRLASAKMSANETNLVVDLASLDEMDKATIATLRGLSQDFVDLAMAARKFGLVSIVGSSMPKDVSGVPKEGQTAIPRQELPLWLSVASSLPELSIGYGDYGVIHPNFSVKTPATNANAKIRYTSSREHHIFRGYSLREGVKFKQYHDLSRRVIAASVYQGRDYSFGDDYMWRCANLEATTGNLGTWVEADMNHHLVFAAAQMVRIESRVAIGMSMADVETIAR